ncbi:RidA family protein [Cochlodiniinecator piscidefendens]|uniref:RidA family protein n=1 Tax=Cochlodiniinecator piscidefendens TaxID=2715756 RepID=UPI001409F9A0|nr:RidA family protein [Cochlodiniinecator piscidefendens]
MITNSFGIERIIAPTNGRSLASVYAGLVYAVAYDPMAADGIKAQTYNALAFLDQRLSELGSEKSALLQVTIYLDDMSLKTEMDEVWCEWIGPKENWPQRACVGVDLGDEGKTLIEIVVTAIKLGPSEDV